MTQPQQWEDTPEKDQGDRNDEETQRIENWLRDLATAGIGPPPQFGSDLLSSRILNRMRCPEHTRLEGDHDTWVDKANREFAIGTNRLRADVSFRNVKLRRRILLGNNTELYDTYDQAARYNWRHCDQQSYQV